MDCPYMAKALTGAVWCAKGGILMKGKQTIKTLCRHCHTPLNITLKAVKAEDGEVYVEVAFARRDFIVL